MKKEQIREKKETNYQPYLRKRKNKTEKSLSEFTLNVSIERQIVMYFPVFPYNETKSHNI